MRRFLIAAAVFGFAVAVAQAKDLASMQPDEIATLQQRLADAGCYQGEVDGKQGVALDAAVRACPHMDPELRIETGMHVAPIRRIAVDQACSIAVTVSDDKTVRVWRLPEGRPIHVLRPPTGFGNNGKVYAAAVSPDGSMAAFGGWDAYFEDHGSNSLYLFDPATGGNVRRVGEFGNAILHLAFSPDGSKVAVSLGGKEGVRVLDVASGNELMADKDFDAGSSGVTFGPDGSLYVTSEDGFLRRYGPDLKQRGKVKTSATSAFGVAIDRAGRRLAVGHYGTPRIDLFDAVTLRSLGVIENKDLDSGDFQTVVFLRDGHLVAAGTAGQPLSIARIFDQQGHRVGADVPISGHTIFSLQPCGEAAVFATGDPSFGFVAADGRLDILGRGRTADMRTKIRDAFAVSRDGTEVYFGLGLGAEKPVVFDLLAGTIVDATEIPSGMSQPDTEGLKIAGWENGVSPTLDGKQIELEHYDMARSAAVRPDRDGLVLGTSYLLGSFTPTGEARWKTAVPGEVWGVDLARDGDLVVGAYNDGTIRWHRWSDGKELLALFVDVPTRRFVAWTPSGYYLASPGAEDLIGWHINRGWEQTADFFPASRFRDKFNRPDIVRLVLQTMDEDAAVKQADLHAKRHEDAKPLIQRLPPVITIVSPSDGTRVPSGAVEIKYRLRSPSGAAIDRVDVFVDGAKVEARGFDRLDDATATATGETTGSLTIPMPDHDAEIGLVARAGALVSDMAHLHLAARGGGGDTLLKPNLYALLVGISDYDMPDMKLKYAAKDASDLAAALRQQAGGLYNKVEVKLVTDKEASVQGVKEALLWLSEQATARDMTIVFLGGHGTMDGKGKYWFMTHETDPRKLYTTALSKDDILGILGDLPGKKMLLLDACNSGGALTGMKASVDVSAAVNDFGLAENGLVAFASSTGKEFSLELPEVGNGAFTHALIEGLEHGNLLGKPTISLSELDAYVENRVKELTHGAQHPVMVRGSDINFPIGVAEGQ